MTYYTPAQRINYYKSQLEASQKENAQLLKQITDLTKEIDRLRCEINVLRNKSNER